MNRRTSFGLRLLTASLVMMLACPARGLAEGAAHGIAMHGAPALRPDFDHLPHANPEAPKGGRLVLGQLGAFDSLNPMIVKGQAAFGLRDYVYESLLARSHSEPFTLYASLAERIEVPDDRSSIVFHLDRRARFADGKPVSPDDVVFSWRLLKEKGLPFMRAHYRSAARAEITGERAVRFVFDGSGNREAPLLVALMPILPRHLIDPDAFDRTTLEPPIGSGPYRVASLEAGRTITYQRRDDWWAASLPVNRGRYNFDEVRIDYFRDASVMLEAFKAGQIHLRPEEDPSRWAESYRFAAVTEGRVVKAEFPIAVPAGMTALAMNTRRASFTDQRVRQALILIFDFEWINRSLYHGAYTRTQSFFERSALSSSSRPADRLERALLAPFPEAVKSEVLAGTYRYPVSDGSGHNRANLSAAVKLLTAAGYRLEGGRLVGRDGRQMTIEILASSRAQERLLLTYVAALGKLGIAARVRQVDSSQYQERLKTFDFDMIQTTWPASLSPGNEQVNRWGSAAAGIERSLNYPGVRNPAVDAMIDALLRARERDDFEAAVRALDRVLLSGDYVIPLFHLKQQWVAHWSHLKYPQKTSLYGYLIDTWWSAAR